VRSLLPVAIGGALLAGCAGETTVEVVEAADRGEALFADATIGREGNTVACIDCHATAVGGPPYLTGAILARALDRPSFWGGQELDAIEATEQCLYFFMGRPEGLEPGDPVADDLFAYLDALEGDDALAEPQPFSIGSVVFPGGGDAGRGEPIYAAACASCHGAKGTGEGRLVPGAPVLPDGTLAAHPSPEYTEEERRLVFVEKIRHGPFLGYGGTMPPFSLEVLPDDELADLLSYMGVE
jgi:thiosulfate dehydrogenase